MELTTQQQKVVDSTDKRILVLSCAGSGKTTVITLRIARLWKNGVKPDEILALTFSNKAAQEMKSRICKENPNLGAKVNVRTFHSFGLDIIRKYNLAFGFTGSVKIAKTSDCKTILSDILKRSKKMELAGAKLEEYLKKRKSCEKFSYNNEMEQIFREYCDTLRQKNLVDMDDMIWMPVTFMTDHEKVRKIIAGQYKYIFVDEYQDTNEAQNQLLSLVVDNGTNTCFVGDDDQAIYEWRGARPRYIREKAKSKEYSVIKLETNFRSQQAVIDAANSIIRKNENRIDKVINAERPLLVKPVYARLGSQIQEAAYVANKIKQLIDSEKYNASDMAVLCRINDQIEPIKAALEQYGINTDLCEIDENAQYGHFISVLQSIVDLSSLNDLGNAINFPNNCFDSFIYMDAKAAYCDHYGQNLEFSDIEWLDRLYNSDIYFENCDSFRERYGMIQQLHNAEKWTPTQIIELYIEFMNKHKYSEEYAEQYHFLRQVYDISQNYEETFGKVTLSDFLYHLNLTLGLGDTARSTNLDAVNILTMHRAKGLEFKVAFIVGVQVGILPNDFFIKTIDDLEAERRLFYVALTRAKDLLFLTSYRDPLGGSIKSPVITHGFMAEIPQIAFATETEYLQGLASLPKLEEKATDSLSKAANVSVNKEKSVEVDYEKMRHVLSEDALQTSINDTKTHKKRHTMSALIQKYNYEKLDNLSLLEFEAYFSMAALENIPLKMSQCLEELVEKIASLDDALKKYPDEEQITHKFSTYYIPETAKLLYSYVEYDKASVSAEILTPVYDEVLKSLSDVNDAISIRIDDIFRIATMGTNAKAEALQRIIAKDGYKK